MKTLWMMLLAVTVTANANVDKDIYLTIDSDAVNTSQKSLSGVKSLHSSNGISVLKIKASDIENLSALMHAKFNRCGGFIVHDSEQEALNVITNNNFRNTAKNANFLNYTISEGATVQNMLTQVNEFSIRETILKLSSFKNRYYKAQTGVDSQAWLKKSWETLSAGRTDVSVDYFKHSSFPQPSIIMTVEGTTMKDEIVVIGGHADSIAGYWGRERARAPGADDNASGIATITEVIRVMMDSSYKPQRTIKFMAYAAEEVGLLGSKAIANDFKANGKKVVGVVQFDMTNHKGTSDLDIVFMTDFTNQAQTKFMGTLIDTYIPGVTWGYSKCGYGCSDHASWHNAGYPASMPFESTMGDINGKIHTKNDTIDAQHSHGTADHAEKFTRLGVAFMVEMGK
jgi:leucyl aminopeptidase